MSKVNKGKLEYVGSSSVISVRALEVTQMDNGFIEIRIPTRDLSSEECQFLDRMFPNTGNQIEKLLRTEALLSNMNDPGFDEQLTPTVFLRKEGTQMY